MKAQWNFSALLLILSKAPAQGAEQTSRLNVHIPSSLHIENGYDHRPALFGFPRHDGSIIQNVYYADDTLCDPNVDTSKGYPRRLNNSRWLAPFILLVDRGDCTFVQKVRNAQNSGAAAVLIADNMCLCYDAECTSNQPCQPTEPIMADDGSGSDVSIPSFLVFKMDADRIKEELKANRPVFVEMTWYRATPDGRVEYDIWTTPLSPFTRFLWTQFKPLALALGDQAYFTPHMYVIDGLRSGCQGVNGENECPALCTNNGRYCAMPPIGIDGISGADIVAESLRRICIWNHYGADDGIGDLWWDYVIEFESRCASEDSFSSPECIQQVYQKFGINGDSIDRCIKDSGGLSGHNSNNKLELAIASQASRGVVSIPTAQVDNYVVDERLTARNLFHSICQAYDEEFLPSICRECSRCPDLESCVENGICFFTDPSPSNKTSGGGLPEVKCMNHSSNEPASSSSAMKMQSKGRFSSFFIAPALLVCVVALYTFRL